MSWFLLAVNNMLPKSSELHQGLRLQGSLADSAPLSRTRTATIFGGAIGAKTPE